ncbi:hypothetical protein BCD48_44585 [Pseudofrankia sp. BMG5.36]|nr:hypothetical protein BCD48_44585 [Pseudofrankia sp. BMG5.36]
MLAFWTSDLHPFTRGLRNDHDAVLADFTGPHSSGDVEGNVNRIKMIKKQMHRRSSGVAGALTERPAATLGSFEDCGGDLKSGEAGEPLDGLSCKRIVDVLHQQFDHIRREWSG